MTPRAYFGGAVLLAIGTSLVLVSATSPDKSEYGWIFGLGALALAAGTFLLIRKE